MIVAFMVPVPRGEGWKVPQVQGLCPHQSSIRPFSGRNNSLVKQIAQQRRAEGGQLQKEEVRTALLRLGWDAYVYLSGCLSLQMQAVARSLPEPLNSAERRIFEEMHLPQPHYGNLPLLLLGERLEF